MLIRWRKLACMSILYQKGINVLALVDFLSLKTDTVLNETVTRLSNWYYLILDKLIFNCIFEISGNIACMLDKFLFACDFHLSTKDVNFVSDSLLPSHQAQQLCSDVVSMINYTQDLTKHIFLCQYYNSTSNNTMF